MRRFFIAAAFIAAAGGAASAQNWPSFRGANAAGTADGKPTAVKWNAPAGENVAWKTPLAGVGWGSPVVWGDHVFVTAGINTGAPEPFKAGQLRAADVVKPAAPYRWVVYDVSLATGQIRWQKEVANAVPADGTHIRTRRRHRRPTVSASTHISAISVCLRST